MPPLAMPPLDVFPVSWDAADADNGYAITLFGKTPAGELVAARIAFYPYFFVRVPQNWGVGQIKLFITEAATRHRAVDTHCRALTRTSLWGFTNGDAVPLIQLAFATHKDMRFAARALGRTHQTFESSVDPLLRFFHVRDVHPAQWVRIAGCSPVDEPLTTADIEVTCGFASVAPSPGSRPPSCTWRPVRPAIGTGTTSRRGPRSRTTSRTIRPMSSGHGPARSGSRQIGRAHV